VEVLGEWDHGMLDPVENFIAHHDHDLSFQNLKTKVLTVEHKVEDAAKTAFHKVEHAMEEMIHHGADVSAVTGDELAGPAVDTGVWLAVEEKIHPAQHTE